MVEKILTAGLIGLTSATLAVFLVIVYADLVNILFGPTDEVLYLTIYAFLCWSLLRLRRHGGRTKRYRASRSRV